MESLRHSGHFKVKESIGHTDMHTEFIQIKSHVCKKPVVVLLYCFRNRMVAALQLQYRNLGSLALAAHN